MISSENRYPLFRIMRRLPNRHASAGQADRPRRFWLPARSIHVRAHRRGQRAPGLSRLTARPAIPRFRTRDPSNPNYPRATELADGTLPPVGAEGNFIVGPTHAPAPETIAKDGVPRGTVTSFTFSSKDSVIYNPGLIRDDVAGCGNSSIMIATTAPGDKSNMIVTTSHPGIWSRNIEVYVPANYVRGTEAPFIVLGDGGSTAWRDMNATLDNLIAQRRVPPMVSIQIGNGGQDAQGAQRGREYD